MLCCIHKPVQHNGVPCMLFILHREMMCSVWTTVGIFCSLSAYISPLSLTRSHFVLLSFLVNAVSCQESYTRWNGTACIVIELQPNPFSSSTWCAWLRHWYCLSLPALNETHQGVVVAWDSANFFSFPMKQLPSKHIFCCWRRPLRSSIPCREIPSIIWMVASTITSSRAAYLILLGLNLRDAWWQAYYQPQPCPLPLQLWKKPTYCMRRIWTALLNVVYASVRNHTHWPASGVNHLCTPWLLFI